MVNPNKHKNNYDFEELLQELELTVIDLLNKNPEGIVEELSVNNKNLEKIYSDLLASDGSYISYSNCLDILQYIFRTDFTSETIKSNYHGIKLDVELIDSIKMLCYEALDVFHRIQQLQNKNIDKDSFLGLESVIGYEMANNTANKPIEFYFSEEFENIIRLRPQYKEGSVV